MSTWFPKAPETLEEAHVKPAFVRDVILKMLYVQGELRGYEFGETLKISFSLIDREIQHLRENECIGPTGGAGVGGSNGIDFGLTRKGRELAQDLFQRAPYIGSAPVSLEAYRESMKRQRLNSRGLRRAHMDRAFEDMVISPKYLDALGPALSSGGPIFVHGKPGNGKTMLAERLARLFRHPIFIPYALDIDGQIIQVFDEKVHIPVALEQLPANHPVRTDPRSVDARWACVYRPFIIVGGELTLPMLDLIFHPSQSAYEAPFQLKANGGVLLVDDFGRQMVKPRDFLNRWIYPLEKGMDFLTLASGKKISVPFDQMLIFSTNLHPQELADEAFWRRLKYKLEMPGPTEAEFTKIFTRVAERAQLVCKPELVEHLIQKHYREPKREIRAVHARDILNHVQDHIAYNGLEPIMTRELIDAACELYFSSVDPRINLAWREAA